MKTEKAYVEIMNQLDIIHAENLQIMRFFLISNGIDEKQVDSLVKAWDKRYTDERKKYE